VWHDLRTTSLFTVSLLTYQNSKYWLVYLQLFSTTSISWILTDCIEKCTLEMSYINVFLFVNNWNFLLKTLKMLQCANTKLYFNLNLEHVMKKTGLSPSPYYTHWHNKQNSVLHKGGAPGNWPHLHLAHKTSVV
jgi:hypothetical protein